MADRRRLLADLTPLRDSAAFRRLWTGTTLSSVGGAMTAFAVVLQVYDLTHSSFAVGVIGVAQMVPTFTVGLLCGPVVDAIDRRKLVLITSTCLALVSAALTVQAFAGLDLLWLLYALVAVQASLSAVDRPARSTFVPALLPPGQLAAGLALNRVSFQMMMTAGPALAGLITAAPHLGLRACYLADTVSFAAALYGMARLPAMRPLGGVAGSAPALGGVAGLAPALGGVAGLAPALGGVVGSGLAERGTARPGPRAVAEGIGFIRRSQVISGAFLADLAATVFALPVALFPAINAERFGGDPRTLGLFTTAIGVGGLVSAAFSGPVGHIVRQGRAMLVAVAVWGAAFAGFAVAPSLWLTLGLLAVAGAADAFTVVFRGAIVAVVTPDLLRGRVMAADYVVGAGGGQLGNLEAGAVAAVTSPVISAVAGGLATLAAVLVIGLALPAFTRYRSEPDAAVGARCRPESAAAH